jgi:hypothetical protein
VIGKLAAAGAGLGLAAPPGLGLELGLGLEIELGLEVGLEIGLGLETGLGLAFALGFGPAAGGGAAAVGGELVCAGVHARTTSASPSPTDIVKRCNTSPGRSGIRERTARAPVGGEANIGRSPFARRFTGA